MSSLPPCTAEAVEALIEAATALLDGSRHQDAVRLLEQAVALGCRRPAALLDLARVQAVCGKPDDAFATLAMVDDDPSDPTVAAERDHTAANTRVFTDPGWSVPRLLDIAERWRLLGNVGKEAWAHANAGVAYFYLSRMEDAGRQLEQALATFDRTGDRAGTVATASFLCLAKPTDRRVPGWLADGLAWADQSGDRSKQMTTLTTLAWHHFFRSLWGSPDQTAEAEGFARRLAALSEELGATDMAVHGYGLLTITERFSGRIDDAVTHVTALERLAAAAGNPDPWLGWAASFAVAVANGVASASPPFPPASKFWPTRD